MPEMRNFTEYFLIKYYDFLFINNYRYVFSLVSLRIPLW